MQISQDPGPINALLNAPGVRDKHNLPGKDAEIDCTVLLETGGFSVVGDGYGWLFNKVGECTYETHTAILPEMRGALTLKRTRECANRVFLGTDCMEIVTRCPATNIPAIKLTKVMGFTELYTAVGAFGGIDLIVYSLPLSHWAARAKDFRKIGREFLEDTSDELKNQYVGIAEAMIAAGNPEKAKHVYSIWETMCEHQGVN
jgi:hypothetical protein